MIAPDVTGPSAAFRHYRMLELDSRMASIGPHSIVCALYEQLLRSLDLAIAASGPAEARRRDCHIARARSIVVVLEASVDDSRGDELAARLARVYRACASALDDSICSEADGELREIRRAIADIAYALQALSGN
ncbi:MAG TPA: flagellar protein FliS [Sphingorhabdus sp.]|nr:flagellar protein FliS [Sphingorhabdus sp.]